MPRKVLPKDNKTGNSVRGLMPEDLRHVQRAEGFPTLQLKVNASPTTPAYAIR